MIGRYRIEAELGHGAMGAVYRANDPLMDRTVAIKTILAGVLSGPQATEYRERFTREARAAGRLTHPGIVTVYDVGENDGVPYLVMEFVKGRTLAAAMEAGQRFSFERIYEMGYQVADALGYAHRNGVVHRDIKPANILLAEGAPGEPERAKIADLGVAKLSASQITTTGQLLGTPAFMPPEQFTGAPLDGRADLFSLGVILYWLATGDKPFSGDTITAVSYKIVHSDPALPRKINPAVPAALETIVLKCLEKDPARRYATGEALAADLAAAHAGRELNQTGVAMRSTSIGGTIPAMAPVSHLDGDPNTTLDSDMRHLAADRAAHASNIEMSGIEQLKAAEKKASTPEANSVTDDSGFMALVDPDAYRSFVREDWTFELLRQRFTSEMNERHGLIWGTGREEVWRVQIGFTDRAVQGFREFVAPIAVSNGRLLLTNYESLSMAAQFEEVQLPESHQRANLIAVDSGVYRCKVVQLADPTLYDLGVRGGHADFLIQLTALSESAVDSPSDIPWID